MRTFVVMVALGGLALGAGLDGQQDPRLYAGLKWRSIGPVRAGRASAVSGVAGNPAVYYMGTPGGGVWKTTDGGMIWKPIFDAVPVASIGAVAVAPSNPDIVYVGTGDVSEVGGSVNAGSGVYKSTDAGATWTHVGLDNTWHIGALWIDPHDPRVVVVAALGHTFSKDADRGIFKTTDGGASWRKTLYKDDETGAIDVAFDAVNPKIGFATVWGHYVAPGATGAVLNGTNRGAFYKTTDEGDTWTPVSGGLPVDRVGRSGVAVASGGQRVFAIVTAQPGGGLYRSDDGGSSWRKATTDPRIVGNGYFSKVYVDPKSPDIVYVMQTSMYRSSDGGRTFVAWKGAPGGDDNHVLWIDPTNSNWMLMGSDQGAVASLDGGRTWTSWYNQPTGQMYHLSTDNRWPYWIYGMQQDSGSIGTRNRGDYGNVGILDWDAVAGYEFGYIVPDPLNPNVIYAGGEARGVWRLDRTSRQVRTISPNISRNGDSRTAVNPPLVFSPHDPHALYEGTQYVLLTRDSGDSWQRVSPDLTVRQDATPSASAPAAPGAHVPNRTAISTIAISPVKNGVIWAGTTNGVVQASLDAGATWKNVSPPGLTRFHQISMIEASHFDAATAFVAAEGHEANDFAPHLFRTRDGGSSWQETAGGIPAGSFARVVREDPVRRGMLYAGTENGVSISFDDGDRWQPLQLNLPTVSVRDLLVHDQDVVICTYGRAIWILDDVTPLRQLNSAVTDAEAFLFAPHQAIRVRRNDNNDTPIPPDLPAADNPPAGAVIDYYLKSAAAGIVAIGIYDARGDLVRQLSSVADAAVPDEPPNVPAYWLAKPQPLSKRAGAARAVWDLRSAPPPALRHDYPISATVEQTPESPEGPLAPPGKYEVRLTVDGRTIHQPLTVAADPRVHVTQAEFDRQADFERRLVVAMRVAFDGYHDARELREAAAARLKEIGSRGQAGTIVDALKALDAKAAKLVGESVRGAAPAPPGGRPAASFQSLNGNLAALLDASDLADGAPTEPMMIAWVDYCGDLGPIVQ
jgi:photosystem II stability/assembly factor-like uncharacterized protein